MRAILVTELVIVVVIMTPHIVQAAVRVVHALLYLVQYQLAKATIGFTILIVLLIHVINLPMEPLPAAIISSINTVQPVVRVDSALFLQIQLPLLQP